MKRYLTAYVIIILAAMMAASCQTKRQVQRTAYTHAVCVADTMSSVSTDVSSSYIIAEQHVTSSSSDIADVETITERFDTAQRLVERTQKKVRYNRQATTTTDTNIDAASVDTSSVQSSSSSSLDTTDTNITYAKDTSHDIKWLQIILSIIIPALAAMAVGYIERKIN